MRPSCSQIYCSSFLDLIFSALLESKLSRNAVTYLNCARNPEQFWGIWGYLSHATCPVLTAQLIREFLLSLLSHIQPHSHGAQGCPCRVFTGMCFATAPSLPSHPSGDGERSQGSTAGPAHTPQGPPPQDTICSCSYQGDGPAHLKLTGLLFRVKIQIKGDISYSPMEQGLCWLAGRVGYRSLGAEVQLS